MMLIAFTTADAYCRWCWYSIISCGPLVLSHHYNILSPTVPVDERIKIDVVWRGLGSDDNTRWAACVLYMLIAVVMTTTTKKTWIEEVGLWNRQRPNYHSTDTLYNIWFSPLHTAGEPWRKRTADSLVTTEHDVICHVTLFCLAAFEYKSAVNGCYIRLGSNGNR